MGDCGKGCGEDGASIKAWGIMYKAVVQEVLLYGSKMDLFQTAFRGGRLAEEATW